MKLSLIKLFFAVVPFFFFTDNLWKVKTSAITFKIKNAGITVDGSFAGLTADIKFNPLKPEETSITASVTTASLNTGSSMKDEHLSKPEYFDSEKYPKITLQSVKVEKTGPITFNGTFKLTMKGVTKEIAIPFTFMQLPEKTEFKGSFTLNRRDYNVGGSSMTMADNADVSIIVDVAQ
jgi:polyisoprenoid-binding protein YceI